MPVHWGGTKTARYQTRDRPKPAPRFFYVGWYHEARYHEAVPASILPKTPLLAGTASWYHGFVVPGKRYHEAVPASLTHQTQ